MVDELVNERALRMKENIEIKSMLGKPLDEQLQKLTADIKELKEREKEIRIEVPKNIETELKEWLADRENIKKGLKKVGNV